MTLEKDLVLMGPQSRWQQGECEPGAFKLDHLQHVKLIFIRIFPPFYPATHNKPFLYTAVAENKKGELSKSEWHHGVSDPEAFKLDHLQPIKLILFRNVSSFLTSLPIINHFFMMQWQKMRKGNSPKVNDTEAFFYPGAFKLDHSQPLKWICSKILHFFTFYDRSFSSP